MQFKIEVYVSPRKDILDPQGKAVEQALHNLRFTGVSNLRVGKYLIFDLEADNSEAAKSAAEEMCRILLANPVVEDFEINISQA